MRKNKAKELMKAGKPVVNGWLSAPSSVTAESTPVPGSVFITRLETNRPISTKIARITPAASTFTNAAKRSHNVSMDQTQYLGLLQGALDRSGAPELLQKSNQQHAHHPRLCARHGALSTSPV